MNYDMREKHYQEFLESITESIIEILKSNFKPTKKYNIGKIDWSEEVGKEF